MIFKVNILSISISSYQSSWLALDKGEEIQFNRYIHIILTQVRIFHMIESPSQSFSKITLYLWQDTRRLHFSAFRVVKLSRNHSTKIAQSCSTFIIALFKLWQLEYGQSAKLKIAVRSIIKTYHSSKYQILGDLKLSPVVRQSRFLPVCYRYL